MKRDCTKKGIRWSALQNLLCLREQNSRAHFISLAPSVTAAIFCFYLPRFPIGRPSTQENESCYCLLSRVCKEKSNELGRSFVFRGYVKQHCFFFFPRSCLLERLSEAKYLLILIFCIFLVFIASRSPGHKVLFLAYFSLCNFHGRIQHAPSTWISALRAGRWGILWTEHLWSLCAPASRRPWHSVSSFASTSASCLFVCSFWVYF